MAALAGDHGLPRITLTTFRDIPWNGPWYARRGFAELPRPEWGPQLRRQWQIEVDAGVHLAPRIAMVRVLPPRHRR
ncbi:MAG TPA: hypothetical protein VFU43_18605 [Streptosporangiaceae bacterium]|nr:hypothetical protein [Streptosporangiaceae bacterium]